MDGSEMQNAGLDWLDGDVPVSRRHGDRYFSDAGGLAEARQVFLAGNGLPERFRPGFEIAELGFGTGLNALAAWAAWLERGAAGDLGFTSFEAWPLPTRDMARALARWPELAGLAEPLIAALATGARTIRLDGLRLRLTTGDARETVPDWTGRADAWFLDGFSPARNPEMWEPALLAAVGRRTASGGTCATWCAAGHVRAALADAGFAVARAPGFGRKRHMTRGALP